MGSPSVAFLYLSHEWRGGGRCPYHLLVSGGDCVSIDKKISACAWDESDRSCVIGVHLIRGASFVIRIHVELSFEGKVPVCRFIVLMTFYMAEEGYNMHLCAGGGNRLYHIPVRV